MAKLGKNISRTNEDKLLSFYYKSVDYFEKNKNRVYTILTIIAVIIAVIFVFFRNQASKSESASLELSKVKQFYLSGSYQQAINGDSLGMSKGLIYIVDNYGSTESGEAAKVLLANSYYFMRDFDKAEKFYKEYSGSNEIYRATSFAGLASIYEAKNDFPNAAKLYEKASKVSKIVSNNDEYLLNAIRAYSLSKDNENTKRTIKELKTEYPKSKLIAQLTRYEIPE